MRPAKVATRSSKSRKCLAASIGDVSFTSVSANRVVVTDENDEPPIFDSIAGCVSVTEFHDVRTPLTTIHATDRDDPSTPNGHVTFSIEAGNDKGLFGLATVDVTSARLVAVKSLVGHHGNYTVRLRAEDSGTPPIAAHQDVEVCVSDFNDHAPVFVYPEHNNTTLRVLENATVGSVITTVSAVDEDAGANSEVRYSIRPVGHWKWFQIDQVSGQLTLVQPLDREKQKILQVSALLTHGCRDRQTDYLFITKDPRRSEGHGSTDLVVNRFGLDDLRSKC